MRIIMDSNSLIQSSTSENITGTIYFDFGKCQFPSEDWDDFVSVVLDWWMREINSAINNSNHFNKSFKLLFMDGPYYIQCVFISENLIKMTCFENRTKDIIRFEEICSIYDLQNEVHCTIKKFVNAAYRQKIINGYVELLHRQVYPK